MEPGGAGVTVPDKSITFTSHDVKANAAVRVSRIDHTPGDVLAAYDKMGAPVYPSQEQLRQLREVERSAPPQVERLKGGSFTLVVPAQGLAVGCRRFPLLCGPGRETADLSTPLRSGRDDKLVGNSRLFVGPGTQPLPCEKFVISTGA
jgi:hypothetical protein